MDSKEDVNLVASTSKTRVNSQRLKTTLRLKYDAEAGMIRRTHGSLEEIRQKLGVSRRKICQLLMVDPSAWTRWSRDETKVPPHIYRALDWYLQLQKRGEMPDFSALTPPLTAQNHRESQRTWDFFLWRGLIVLNIVLTIWLIFHIEI